jgi:ABC-type proline/glycine betaine transport system permease subunit
MAKPEGLKWAAWQQKMQSLSFLVEQKAVIMGIAFPIGIT